MSNDTNGQQGGGNIVAAVVETVAERLERINVEMQRIVEQFIAGSK